MCTACLCTGKSLATEHDVRADPYEQRNLVADPAHADELEQLRTLLRKWRVQQGEDLEKVAMPEDARTGPLPYAG